MMDCPDCLGVAELIVAGWVGVLLGVAIMALLQMAGDRSGVRERADDLED
jgi:purine-cytosine permease-like protein